MKTRMLKIDPKCCFEVDSMQEMGNWQILIDLGTFEELEGEESKNVMQKLITQLMPIMTGQKNQPGNEFEQLHKFEALNLEATVYRIKIEEKTGRFVHFGQFCVYLNYSFSNKDGRIFAIFLVVAIRCMQGKSAHDYD